MKTQRFEQGRQLFSRPSQRGQEFSLGALELAASLPLPLQRFEFLPEVAGGRGIAAEVAHDLTTWLAKPQLVDRSRLAATLCGDESLPAEQRQLCGAQIEIGQPSDDARPGLVHRIVTRGAGHASSLWAMWVSAPTARQKVSGPRSRCSCLRPRSSAAVRGQYDSW